MVKLTLTKDNKIYLGSLLNSLDKSRLYLSIGREGADIVDSKALTDLVEGFELTCVIPPLPLHTTELMRDFSKGMHKLTVTKSAVHLDKDAMQQLPEGIRTFDAHKEKYNNHAYISLGYRSNQ